MTTSYKVIAAAAFVRRQAGRSELLYRDAPVPADATNAEELLEGGFIGELSEGETAGGHPSDIPPEVRAADAQSARAKAKADADADAKADASAKPATAPTPAAPATK